MPRGQPKADNSCVPKVMVRYSCIKDGLLGSSDKSGSSLLECLYLFAVVLFERGPRLFQLIRFLLQFQDMFFELIGQQLAIGDFGGSKINELEMSIFIQHEIFGLGKQGHTLRSRCVMPLVCKYSRVLTISAM